MNICIIGEYFYLQEVNKMLNTLLRIVTVHVSHSPNCRFEN